MLPTSPSCSPIVRMAKVTHEGADHSLFMPLGDERETWERLDQLLREVQASTGLDRCALVVRHTAALFAGIESSPALETWPTVTDSSRVSPRWVETVLGIEIDRTILRMLDNPEGCIDCLIAWIRHLIFARIVASEWAWARDADGLFG